MWPPIDSRTEKKIDKHSMILLLYLKMSIPFADSYVFLLLFVLRINRYIKTTYIYLVLITRWLFPVKCTCLPGEYFPNENFVVHRPCTKENSHSSVIWSALFYGKEKELKIKERLNQGIRLQIHRQIRQNWELMALQRENGLIDYEFLLSRTIRTVRKQMRRIYL